MVASISSSVNLIVRGLYENPLLQFNGVTAADDQFSSAESRSKFDSSSHGLDSHGFPAFFSYLPPHTEENKKCLKWLLSYESVLRNDISKHQLECPITPEDIAAHSAAVVQAKAAAVAAPVKGKGAAATAAAASVAVVLPELKARTVPLFSALTLCNVTATFSVLISSISMTETRLCAAHFDELKDPLVESEQMAAKCLNELVQMPKDRVSCGGEWTGLYSMCQKTRLDVLFLLRNYADARVLCLNVLRNLQSNCAALSYEILSRRAQLWFFIKFTLANMAIRQGRFRDVESIASSIIAEADKCRNYFWKRGILVLRAQALFKLGEFPEAMNDVDAAIALYKETEFVDVALVRVCSAESFSTTDVLTQSNTSMQ